MFFDLLGVIAVAYPARVGTIINYMVAAATFLYLAKKASLPGNRGRSSYLLWKKRSVIPWRSLCFSSYDIFLNLFKVGVMFGTWPVPRV